MPVTRWVVAAVTALLVAPPMAWQPSQADGSDWDVPDGHFFLQTGGYTVSDAGGAPFWSEMQRLGGVDALGYPVSQRFVYKGFTTQAFQKQVLQWRRDEGRAAYLNVFDELSAAGKDDWLLASKSTPRPAKLDDRGKSWDDVVAAHLALLDANPAFRDAYQAAADPLEDYGLPTSGVQDLGPLLAVRTQRVVLQLWKQTVPWATAGQFVVANGGDVAKQAGLFPVAALAAEQVPTPELAKINAYRLAAGAGTARLDPALMQSAQSHVAYYDANKGDPSLAGMGLHQERPDAPGFTGATMGDRARAAGYRSGAVTENAGFGGVASAIDWYMNTVNHRLPLIHPSAVDLGYAQDGDGFGVIDVGLRSEKNATAVPSVYPADGATGVPTSWDAAETPDPLPGVPRPVGYPLTVAFAVSHRVDYKTLSLAGPDGQPLEIETPTTAWMRAVAIIPRQPLQPGTSYTARVEALVDGRPVTREWGFTTR